MFPRSQVVHQRADKPSTATATASPYAKPSEPAEVRKTNQDFIAAISNGVAASTSSHGPHPVLVIGKKFTVSLIQDERTGEQTVTFSPLHGGPSVPANPEELAALRNALEKWKPSWNQNGGRDSIAKELILPQVQIEMQGAKQSESDGALRRTQEQLGRTQQQLRAREVWDDLTPSFQKMTSKDLVIRDQYYDGRLLVKIDGLGMLDLRPNVRYDKEHKERQTRVTVVPGDDNLTGGKLKPRQFTDSEFFALRAALERIKPQFDFKLHMFGPTGLRAPSTQAEKDEAAREETYRAIKEFLVDTDEKPPRS
jgi:hypothetical protein